MKKLFCAILAMILLLLKCRDGICRRHYVCREKRRHSCKMVKPMEGLQSHCEKKHTSRTEFYFSVDKNWLFQAKKQLRLFSRHLHPLFLPGLYRYSFVCIPVSTQITITDVTGRVITLDKPAKRYLVRIIRHWIQVLYWAGETIYCWVRPHKMANKLVQLCDEGFMTASCRSAQEKTINFETVASLGKDKVCNTCRNVSNPMVKHMKNVGCEGKYRTFKYGKLRFD
jgi:hypothetical protein